MKKSVFTFKTILFIFMALLIFQTKPLIAHGAASGDYQYTLTGSNATITKYIGSGGNITIPGTIDGYTVTSIGDSAFQSCSNLTSVIIPNSVTSIGDLAFDGCSSLASIDIPSSVTKMGSYVFAYSGLTSVNIPSSITIIPWGAFQSCSNLTSVTIPNNSVTSIGDVAFDKCSSLKSIDIPSSVTKMGFGVFAGSGLTSINIPSSVTSIGDNVFNECSSLKKITIPSSITSIPNEAFRLCTSLASIDIPSSVTSIGEGAFSTCYSLTSMNISSSVTSIGIDAFYNCTGLPEIKVDAGNSKYTSMDGILYDKWKTTLICYPAGKTDSSFTIGNSVRSISDDAFWHCASLVNLTIPYTVTSIGKNAFERCSSLTKINVDASNSEYCSENGVLYDRWKTTLICYPEAKTDSSFTIGKITKIGNYAFEGCNNLTEIDVDTGNTEYTSVDGILYDKRKTTLIRYPGGKSGSSFTIRNNVKTIDSVAFAGCSNLTSVTIPASVDTIYSQAFLWCSNLTSVKLLGDEPSMGWEVFEECASGLKVYYIDGKSGYSIYDNKWYGCPIEALHTVVYNGNGSNEGTVPVDSNTYLQGTTVKVLDNTGSLEKTGYTFAGWNTASYGSSINYAANDTFQMGTKNIILYAKWISSTPEVKTVNSLAAIPDIDVKNGTTMGAIGLPSNIDITLSDSTTTSAAITWNNDSNPSYDGNTPGSYLFTGTLTLPQGVKNPNNKIPQCLVTVNSAVPSNISVTGVTLDESSKTLNVGDTSQLTAKVAPNNATNKGVSWSSSNTTAATVDNTGKVTAVAAGTAIITVTTADGNKTAQCPVTVNGAVPSNISVTGLNLNKTTATVELGKNIILTATVLPSNATNKNVIWSSSNPDIATVDQTGKITGIKEGKVTITATTQDGNIKASCQVKVVIDECFIATAAYGSKFQPSVVLLRHFRDDYLLTNTIGSDFVKFYYKHSPPIANFIAHNEVLKTAVRALLTPLVAVVYGLYHPVLGVSVLLAIIMLILAIGKYKFKSKLYRS